MPEVALSYFRNIKLLGTSWRIKAFTFTLQLVTEGWDLADGS
jgi:hypothetical protein